MEGWPTAADVLFKGVELLNFNDGMEFAVHSAKPTECIGLPLWSGNRWCQGVAMPKEYPSAPAHCHKSGSTCCGRPDYSR
ncbi:MAG TPA: hypothetical protein PLK29_09760 [Chiayiivirga sp.]|nr:hypothetical protein [Chiayiivirga sp.]